MVPHPRLVGPARTAALLAATLLAAACAGSSSKPATLTAIAVAPATGHVGVGRTLQLAATGTFSDATTRDVTAEVTWSSSDAGVATVSDAAGTKGLVTGAAQGPVTVTAASGAVSGSAALIATAVVDTTEDAVAADGHCSLREALLNAAAMDQSGSADCAAGTGHDFIRFDLDYPALLTLGSVLPGIAHEVTILGPGSGQLRVNGDDAVRLLEVGAGASLAVEGVTLSYGWAAEGGAIHSDGGTVRVSSSAFTVNGASGRGGAIANLAGTLSVDSSTFTDNVAGTGGGAIFSSEDATATLRGCTFAENLVDSGNGGAVMNLGAMAVEGSTFTGNASTSLSSGAIYNLSGTLSVTSSTFSGNTADTAGGAILSELGTVAVADSTFAGNSVEESYGGGAIFVLGSGTLAVGYSTFAGNAAAGGGGAIGNGGGGAPGGTVTLTATLLAWNRVGGATVNCFNQPGASLLDGGYDLEDADTCGFGASSFPSTDPLELTLADNGGGTWTMALDAASPALDRIPAGSAGCGTTVAADQRGIARPQGAGCDIGAYERE